MKKEKVLKYLKNELKKPIKFDLSKTKFPICPYCKEEFKNREAIIKHLIRNKKEFEEIKEIRDREYEDFKDGESIENFRKKLEKVGIPKEFFMSLNTYIICAKLISEVKAYKHNKWKKELKPKKVKRRESPISPRLRFEILKRDHFTCQYCGRKAPEVELEIDHIEPYSKTKDSSPENLITSCKECNRGKKVKEVV